MEAAGRVNRYVCQDCHAIHGTINLNTGTTPFMIACRNSCCGGVAQSAMYRISAGEVVCGWVWYRPTVREFNTLSASEQEHVLSGGLLLGDFGNVTPMRETDEVTEVLNGADSEGWLSFAAQAYKPEMEVFGEVVDRLSSSS